MYIYVKRIRKFVFFSRQLKNGNWRMLFQQKCPSTPIYKHLWCSKLCCIFYVYLKDTHARDFVVLFHFFCHHSIKDKAEVQNFINVVKLSVTFSYIIGFSWIPRYYQKHTDSLGLFGKNAMVHAAFSAKTLSSTLRTVYLPKLHNSPSSLITEYAVYCQKCTVLLHISPTMKSLTSRFRHKVWLCFFAENA